MSFSNRLKLSLGFLLTGVVFVGITSYASSASAVTAGCDPAKYTAMKQISEIRTAYDVGVTEEIIPQPDSVLQLSCFSQASQISAERGGNIFSGDFKGNLNNVIQGVTNNISSNFTGGLMSRYAISEPAGWGNASFSCDNMRNVWIAAQSDGINTNAEFFSLSEILDIADGTVTTAGTIMQANLGNSSATAAAVRAALSAPPTIIPPMNIDVNANGRLDLCDVMTNLNGSPPPGC